MYSVARGSKSGVCSPKVRAVLMHCRDEALRERVDQVSPFSAARSMILSSMSVILRT